jgi:multidrug efflux pump subunit AcrB
LVAAGSIAFFKLPVSPLPDVDIPTISVQATLPGASPEDVATTVASPLERHLSQIADVTEMTSSSSLGSARVNLQFGINRNINGAARDVQAAINASRADLPTSLRSNPTYRKFNPASAPILIYTLTSDTLTPAELYDAASTVLAQKLSQVEGVGEVSVSGGSLPAVRVELVPQALYKYGIGLEDVRAALGSANAHSPKGGIDVGDQRYQIYSNDQAIKAADYQSLVVAYRNGAAVRLTDVGEVLDSVENLRNLGLSNGKRAVMMIVYRQPGANIIGMVDRVKALMPQLRASVSPAIDVNLAVDRSITIVPKGFVPQQDTGLLIGSIQADQSISFQLMQQKLTQFVDIVRANPAVDTAVGFTGGGGPGPGGGSTNSGTVFASLKPLRDRELSADQVIGVLRDELAAVAGATLFLQPVGDLGAGGRSGNAQYQYTLRGSTFEELNEWTPKIVAALQTVATRADVSSDQQNKGLQANVIIDRMPLRGWESRSARSTTHCTMPSVSGRSRPSTWRATSTT